MLLEVELEVLDEQLLHRGLDLGVAQLALGLPLELRLLHAHADDGREALAHVLAGEVGRVRVDELGLLRVVVDGAGEPCPEALEVLAAVDRVDAVGEGEGRLVEAAVVLEGDLHHVRVLRLLHVERLGLEHLAVVVQVAHEAADAALEVEGPVVLGVRLGPADDPEPLVQVRHLPEPREQRVPVEAGVAEHLRVGREGHERPGPERVGLGDGARVHHVGGRLAPLVLLVVQPALAADLHAQVLGERVDDG